MIRSSAERVTVVDVYPDLLGTYGDGGNATVLCRRLAWRSIAVDLVMVAGGDPLPEHGDLYCIGGGEDGPQTYAVKLLKESGALERALTRGAIVLGVCAGFQILGHSFPDSTGRMVGGLGLLDVETIRAPVPRAVGEVIAEAGLPAIGVLTGFENHASLTRLGPDASPLGVVRRGIGNGPPELVASRGTFDAGGAGAALPGRTAHLEGAYGGGVVGTYLHGPVLARNPALADFLAERSLGELPTIAGSWASQATIETARLRAERLSASSRTARVVGQASGFPRHFVRLLRGRREH